MAAMDPSPRELWAIPAPAFDAMIGGALAGYPEEACGLIFGSGSDLEVRPMRNIQNDLHRADPTAHPRDARTAYAFDPGELARALSEYEKRGRPLRAIYHSHPDRDARFSLKDREEAVLPPRRGEPSYPGAVYIIISVLGGRPNEVRGFVWSREREDFQEVSICRGSSSKTA